MTKRLLCLTALILLLCAGCDRPQEPPVNRQFMAMDTFMSLTAYGPRAEAALAAVEAETAALEKRISVTVPGSELARLNGGDRVPLSPTVHDLLEQSLAMCARTGGLMDISLYPVVSAWGFTRGTYTVPDSATLSRLLERVDYRAVDLAGDALALREGMMLDLGSTAKGFMGDRAAGILSDYGVRAAILDFGGDVRAVGAKPDGSPWKVAIVDPRNPGALLAAVELTDGAIVTSGGYERFFEQDGEIYWHILDPRTGAPARSGLLSVSVIGGSGMLCDGLSTALFVMGREAALAHRAEHGDFELVLVTEGGEVVITPGLEGRFTLISKDYTLVVAP